MAESQKPESARIEVAGGWGHEGVKFTIGVNSGSGGIGFGISDQLHAMATGKAQTTSLSLSMTPENAEEVGRALIAHAEAVRARIAARPVTEDEAFMAGELNG